MTGEPKGPHTPPRLKPMANCLYPTTPLPLVWLCKLNLTRHCPCGSKSFQHSWTHDLNCSWTRPESPQRFQTSNVWASVFLPLSSFVEQKRGKLNLSWRTWNNPNLWSVYFLSQSLHREWPAFHPDGYNRGDPPGLCRSRPDPIFQPRPHPHCSTAGDAHSLLTEVWDEPGVVTKVSLVFLHALLAISDDKLFT